MEGCRARAAVPACQQRERKDQPVRRRLQIARAQLAALVASNLVPARLPVVAHDRPHVRAGVAGRGVLHRPADHQARLAVAPRSQVFERIEALRQREARLLVAPLEGFLPVGHLAAGGPDEHRRVAAAVRPRSDPPPLGGGTAPQPAVYLCRRRRVQRRGGLEAPASQARGFGSARRLPPLYARRV